MEGGPKVSPTYGLGRKRIAVRVQYELQCPRSCDSIRRNVIWPGPILYEKVCRSEKDRRRRVSSDAGPHFEIDRAMEVFVEEPGVGEAGSTKQQRTAPAGRTLHFQQSSEVVGTRNRSEEGP